MYKSDDIKTLAAAIHESITGAHAQNKALGDDSPVTLTLSPEELCKCLSRKRMSAVIRSLLISALLAYPELTLVSGDNKGVTIRTASRRIITEFNNLNSLKDYTS